MGFDEVFDKDFWILRGTNMRFTVPEAIRIHEEFPNARGGSEDLWISAGVFSEDVLVSGRRLRRHLVALIVSGRRPH